MQITARQDACGYHAKSKAIGTDILIGGKAIGKDEFVDGINMSFHPTPAHPDGEFFLDLNHIDSHKTARTDKLIDGRVCHESNGFKHEFYSDGTDRIKWDMLFNGAVNVPPTIRFRIKASKGLSFHKQILTPEQIADGAEYVSSEDEGSYVIMIDDIAKRNNKYRNGNVCTIFSPYYVDENGERSPLLDMNITPDGDNAKMLILSNTQAVTDWINDPIRAGHKLRLDPVLGHDSAGSTFAGLSVVNLSPYITDAIGGTITGGFAYVKTVGGIGTKLGVAFTNQLTGDPQGLDVITQDEYITAGGDNELASYVLSGELAANTKYVIPISMSNFSDKWRADIVPQYDYYFYPKDFINDIKNPIPVTNASINTIRYSGWVEYEFIAGGASKSGQVVPPGVKKSFGRGGSQFSKPPGMKGAFN